MQRGRVTSSHNISYGLSPYTTYMYYHCLMKYFYTENNIIKKLILPWLNEIIVIIYRKLELPWLYVTEMILYRN